MHTVTIAPKQQVWSLNLKFPETLNYFKKAQGQEA